ncbi:glycosyltransferase family 39 protein [Aromatoleum toluclasticum]|uniref:glycosyltransferase family 39 protein n=1 Tax=Aromatoleum toluclasticum TaxID=92003 RepID=UPI001D194086|nr:glycosyltransferase family 39 protein [Aromatoleum toluclasticum]MCC4115842.1 glycosyltransferase family 39 protein [Aromatoleum toluclasticum]
MTRGFDITVDTAANTAAEGLPTISELRVRRVAFALMVAVGLFIVFAFRQYGISNDEEVQHTYGRLLVDFYGSGFADRSAFAYKNLYLYGGLFDLIAAGLERIVPMNVWDLRHLLSAGFGLLGLAGTWMLARRLMGEVPALVALTLLSLTGAWTGAMFTHTKDVPFAATMVWSLYFTTSFASGLPAIRKRDVVGLGIAIGCAFGLRVGAVFAVMYLGAAVIAAAWLNGRDLAARAAILRRAVLGLVPAGIVAAALTALFWPWVALSPGNIILAMQAFSHFAFDLETILDGVVMNIGALPRTYLLDYLLVRLPELMLLGIAVALVTGLLSMHLLVGNRHARVAALPWLPVVLAAAVPIAYTLAAAPPLYNGIRHFTFLLPPLAIVAAAGLRTAWRASVRWPGAGAVTLGACLLLAFVHLATLINLHPYEYLEYNDLIGGLRGAAGRWEEDYWASSLREATGLLNAYVGPQHHAYTVAACAEPVQAAAWLAPGLTMTTDWLAADFFMSPTQMNCHLAVAGPIIAEVVRDGVTIAVVRDRRALKSAQTKQASPEPVPASPVPARETSHLAGALNQVSSTQAKELKTRVGYGAHSASLHISRVRSALPSKPIPGSSSARREEISSS